MPTVLLIYLFGNFLLGLFGKDYVEALELLRILASSSFFVAVYSLFIPIQNMKTRVGSIVKLNLLGFCFCWDCVIFYYEIWDREGYLG